MGARNIKDKIEGLKAQIALHQDKIDRERVKEHPDFGLIAHWEREIEAFARRLKRLETRLERRRRRGRRRK